MRKRHDPVNIELPEPVEFEWDDWNILKNKEKHGVSNDEMEQIFMDPGKKIFHDIFHSSKEDRYIVIGQTEQDRVLYTVFTLRNKKIRIISARDLNRKERNLYP